jgi:magnesium transporter
LLVFDADTDPAEVSRAIEAGEHFWLDLPFKSFGPDHPAAQALGVTEERLDFLARHRGRAMARVEEGQAAIQFVGAVRTEGRVRRVDVVVFATDAALVTLRDRSVRALDERRESRVDVDALGVLDALTDSLLEIAEELGNDVEDAEDRILQSRSRESLTHIADLRQQVSELARIAREQLGMVARSQEELAGVPVRRGNAERRVRDLEGHIARVTYATDSARQTLAEALNLYLSNAADDLTLIATVLVPLTVVGGIFGMNFGWMVDHIDTFWSFAVFGIGGMVASVTGVRLYLRRRGYT